MPPNLLHSCSDLFESYRKWVSSNPQTVGDLETTLRWASYFVAGRMSNSPVVTELTYSLSNLLVLFNDQIIAQSLRRQDHGQSAHPSRSNGVTSSAAAADASSHKQQQQQRRRHRLQLLLTTLEYCEVFIEMSARQVWGERGRWFFICCVQLCKCLFRLVLTTQLGASICCTPATKQLNRRDAAANAGAVGGGSDAAEEGAAGAEAAFGANVNASFELRRSGKIVRSVEGAPPIHLRTWQAPQRRLTAAEKQEQQTGSGGGKRREQRLLAAECVYIVRPLAHLAACGLFGLDSWRSSGLSLLMDLGSLHLYSKERELSAEQRLELSRRRLQLLMYVVRQPVYERWTGERIRALIGGVGATVPLMGGVCAALNDYIPHWQSIYFYMWS